MINNLGPKNFENNRKKHFRINLHIFNLKNNMKNLKSLFLLSFAVFVLAACGGDDDNPANSNEIDGEWTALSFNVNIVSTFAPDGFDPSTTTSSIVGSNLNYDLDLNGDSFTTMGDYTTTASIDVDGLSVPDQVSELSNVSGSGNYTIDGNVISLSGSFFELELDGVMMADIVGPSEATFNIASNGQLTFSQDQTIDASQPGLTSTTTVTSTSVWERR